MDWQSAMLKKGIMEIRWRYKRNRNIFIDTSLALFVFGIVNFIDFYSKSIVYRLVLSKLYKKENLPIRRNGDEILNVWLCITIWFW